MNGDKETKIVLLVEDEAIISIIAAKALKRFGYDVISAKSGEKAVELAIANKTINLVLMDINLGDGIDGTEAARQILAVREIPIVFHTSHSEREMVEKVRGITRYGYVIKNSGDFVLNSSIEMAFDLFNANRSTEKIMNAMRESEEKYRAAFTTSPDSININAMDGRYIEINDGFTKLTGFTRDDVIGLLSTELNIWARPQDREKLVDGLTENGFVENLESLFRCKDGSLKTALMSARIINIKNEPHILSITRDISERKQYEENLKTKNEELEAVNEEINAAMEEMEATNEELIATTENLEKSESRYRVLLDLAVDGILLGTHEGIIIDANESICRIADMPKESFIDKHITMLPFTPSSLEKSPFRFDLLQKGETVINERALIRPDGSEVAVEMYTKMMPDGTYQSIYRDITLRKQAEEKLGKYQLLLQSCLESPKDMSILSIDKKYQYLNFNTFHKNIMSKAYGADIAIGMNLINSITNTDDRKRIKTSFDRALAGDSHIAIEEYGNAFHKYYETRYNPIVNDKNEIIGATAFSANVTERKLYEEKIIKLLAEKELILKEVHHRIKNNMNTIISLLTLQADNLEDPIAVRALENTGSRVNSMMILYDKLYRSADFTNISIKEYLPSLIDEIVSNFSGSKFVKVEKKIDDFVLDIKKLQPLGIIINELLTNIMKYAFNDETNGTITVSATLADNHVSLVIKDNGIGLPESIDFKNSTGFGLDLVLMLTEQIGGKIKIERNAGTSFALEFDV